MIDARRKTTTAAPRRDFPQLSLEADPDYHREREKLSTLLAADKQTAAEIDALRTERKTLAASLRDRTAAKLDSLGDFDAESLDAALENGAGKPALAKLEDEIQKLRARDASLGNLIVEQRRRLDQVTRLAGRRMAGECMPQYTELVQEIADTAVRLAELLHAESTFRTHMKENAVHVEAAGASFFHPFSLFRTDGTLRTQQSSLMLWLDRVHKAFGIALSYPVALPERPPRPPKESRTTPAPSKRKLWR